MSVRWDPLLAAALARELDRELDRARVRALLLDGEARRVFLFLRESTLALELHPLRGWLSILPPRDPPEASRPLPVKVREVAALPDESALVLALPRVRGKDEGVELVVEMVGNRWNAVVVGQRSRVIRHVLLPRDDRYRSLQVGAPYEPPPSTGREGAGEPLTRERWDEILGDPGSASPDDRRLALLRGIAWTSSLNAEAFLGTDGHEAWLGARDPESWGAFVLDSPRGPQPYPVPLPGMAARPTGSLVEAFRVAREADEETGPARELLLPPGLLERAGERVRRARRRLEALKRELEGAGDPEPVRALGDLILARFGEIPRGRDRAVLTDFLGEEVEVELDPTLSPQENAARYYDEAARLARARQALPGRIRKARAALAGWDELLGGIRAGRTPPERLEERLEPSRREGRGAGRPGDAHSLPYRRFTSSGGLEIRVGRGARTNDDLTFRHSSPNDIWLHARQAPGAHVILRWGRDESPPRRDLTEAAVLAALNSEARHSGSVPVDWTWRKYVRKPRKAAPGAVLPDRVQTLFVEPDPGVAKKLAPGDEGARPG